MLPLLDKCLVLASLVVNGLIFTIALPVQPMQQRLWPDAQPLVERLGRDFFRQVPEKPGVYLMRGSAEIVLYVGKAKNLRHRLGSYRVANPERMARRTLRLLNLVKEIGWETCQDEGAALQRESELLLSLKPRFNRAGVWRGPKRFVVWRVILSGLELAVTEEPMEGWACIGPYGAQAIHVHRALVRLLWSRLHPKCSLAEMPAGWWDGKHGPTVVLRYQDSNALVELEAGLKALTTGDAGWLTGLPSTRARFESSVWEEDLELLTKHLVRRRLLKQDVPVLNSNPTTPEPPRWY